MKNENGNESCRNCQKKENKTDDLIKKFSRYTKEICKKQSHIKRKTEIQIFDENSDV